MWCRGLGKIMYCCSQSITNPTARVPPRLASPVPQVPLPGKIPPLRRESQQSPHSLGSSKTERCIRGPKSALRLILSPTLCPQTILRMGKGNPKPEKGNSRPRSLLSREQKPRSGFSHGGARAGARPWGGHSPCRGTNGVGREMEPALHAGLLAASVSPALPLVATGDEAVGHTRACQDPSDSPQTLLTPPLV